MENNSASFVGPASMNRSFRRALFELLLMPLLTLFLFFLSDFYQSKDNKSWIAFLPLAIFLMGFLFYRIARLKKEKTLLENAHLFGVVFLIIALYLPIYLFASIFFSLLGYLFQISVIFYSIFILFCAFLLIAAVFSSKKSAFSFDQKRKKINFDQAFPVVINVIGSVFAIATSILLAKELGGNNYGMLQYYLGIVNTMSYILTCGLSNFLIKNSQYSTDKRAYFSKYFLLSLLGALAILPIYFLISYFALTKLSQNIGLIFLIFGAAYFLSLLTIITSFLTGISRKTLSSLLFTLIPRLAILIVFFIFLLLHRQDAFVDFYLLMFTVLYAGLCLPSFLEYFRKTKLEFSKSELLSLAFFYGTTLTTSLNSQVSKIMQGQVETIDMSSVGALSLAIQIMAVSSVFTTSIIGVFAPNFSRFSRDKKTDELFSLFNSIMRLWSHLIIPFGCGVAVQSRFLLSLLGTDYSPYWMTLVIVDLCYCFDDLTGPCGALLNMSGNEKDELLNGIANFLVFIAVGFALGTYFTWGIAFGLLCGVVVQKIIRIFQIKKRFGYLPYRWRTVLGYFLEISISLTVFYCISLVDSTVLKIGLDCLAGFVLFSIFFLLPSNRDDRRIFENSTYK